MGPQRDGVCLDLVPDPGHRSQVCPGEDAAEADEGDGVGPESEGAGEGEGEGARFPEPGLPEDLDEGRYWVLGKALSGWADFLANTWAKREAVHASHPLRPETGQGATSAVL